MPAGIHALREQPGQIDVAQYYRALLKGSAIRASHEEGDDRACRSRPVDSLPTSANQEDHVSMATFAARRLQPMIQNVAHIIGIELLAAAQGVEFLRPLKRSAALELCMAGALKGSYRPGCAG